MEKKDALLLKADGLSLDLGDGRSLGPFSLALGTGLFVLEGPSGSGKSSLLQVFSGERAPSGGRVSLLGQDLSRLAKKERSRFLASSLSLYSEEASPYLAGSYSYAAKTLGADERKGRAFLRELGFEVASQRFSSLSSGELAASFLSLLLARDTPLLFLDEPFAFLDQERKHRLEAILRRESRNRLIVIANNEPSMLPEAPRLLVPSLQMSGSVETSGDSLPLKEAKGFLRRRVLAFFMGFKGRPWKSALSLAAPFLFAFLFLIGLSLLADPGTVFAAKAAVGADPFATVALASKGEPIESDLRLSEGWNEYSASRFFLVGSASLEEDSYAVLEGSSLPWGENGGVLRLGSHTYEKREPDLALDNAVWASKARERASGIAVSLASYRELIGGGAFEGYFDGYPFLSWRGYGFYLRGNAGSLKPAPAATFVVPVRDETAQGPLFPLSFGTSRISIEGESASLAFASEGRSPDASFRLDPASYESYLAFYRQETEEGADLALLGKEEALKSIEDGKGLPFGVLPSPYGKAKPIGWGILSFAAAGLLALSMWPVLEARHEARGQRAAARFLFMLGGGQTDLALASLLPFLLVLFLASSLYPLALMVSDALFLPLSYGGSYAQAMGLSAYEGIPIVAFAAYSLWALALLIPLLLRLLSSFLGKRK